MKPLALVLPLACAATLLSGCPDTKLPTPTPTVPTPKAHAAAYGHSPASLAMDQLLVAILSNASCS